MRILSLLFFLLCCSNVYAENIEPPKKVVFYLHGAIIEKGDPRPVHPQYGLYDYPAIVSELSKGNFQLISEQRPPDTAHLAYAQNIAGQIKALIAEGVAAQDITVLGFSKGAMITVMTSSVLQNDELNFVIMATCGDWYDKDSFLKTLRLRGKILSVYEKSDQAGSCKALSSRSPGPASFTEIAIDTGRSHGAFYLPYEEWLTPVTMWITRDITGQTTVGVDRQ